MYRNILVAFDGSQGAWKAMRKALLLAKEFGAEIVALSVEDHLPHYPATVGEVQEEKEQENEYFAKVQGEAAALARQQGIALKTVLRVGHAAHTIVRYAQEEGSDLIVMGHKGHSEIWGLFLGSTTDRVLHHVQCDVLVVR